MDAQERSGSEVWDVPYLSIDPKDVGRSYEAIIRVNSQSGKGGVAYLMATEHHLELPRGLQVDFAQRVQAITDSRGGELTGDELMAAFREQYLDHTRPYELLAYTHSSEEDSDQIAARVRVDGEERVIEGEGNGRSLRSSTRSRRRSASPSRSATTTSTRWPRAADAQAAAYVEADVDDEAFWGVGVHGSILTASLRAIVNAVNPFGGSTRGVRAPWRRRSRVAVAILGPHADVAQLARASACHAEGRGFESLHPLGGAPGKTGASFYRSCEWCGGSLCLGLCEVAATCANRDLLVLREVGDLDHTPGDLHASAVAAVGGEPVRAADGRGRVAAARAEAALAVPPELSNRRRGRRLAAHAARFRFGQALKLPATSRSSTIAFFLSVPRRSLKTAGRPAAPRTVRVPVSAVEGERPSGHVDLRVVRRTGLP